MPEFPHLDGGSDRGANASTQVTKPPDDKLISHQAGADPSGDNPTRGAPCIISSVLQSAGSSPIRSWSTTPEHRQSLVQSHSNSLSSWSCPNSLTASSDSGDLDDQSASDTPKAANSDDDDQQSEFFTVVVGNGDIWPPGYESEANGSASPGSLPPDSDVEIIKV